MSGDFGRFGVNTYAFTQQADPLAGMRQLHQAGFRAFELMAIHGHFWIDASPRSLDEIRAFTADNGLEIISLNTANIDINIASNTPDMRAYSIALVSAMIRLGGAIGAEGFILGPGKPNPLFPLPFAQLEEHFFTALDTLVPVAQDSGIALWAENMPFSFLAGADDLVASLARYGDDGIGICYDVANAHFIGEDPIDGLAWTGERLALVHISDTTRQRYRHDPVGKGDLDFARLAGPIARCRAPRPVFEIISDSPVRDITASARALLEEGY